MCLRSGWLDYLKLSIDRVLKNHPLDGVYYDWNVALYCENPLHEGKAPANRPRGHWDMDELLDLMEWTRQRVGPDGLVIIHNTTVADVRRREFRRLCRRHRVGLPEMDRPGAGTRGACPWSGTWPGPGRAA